MGSYTKNRPGYSEGLSKYHRPRPEEEPPSVPGARWLPLSHGKFALVDEDVFDDVNRWNWSYHVLGHAFHGGGGTPTVLLHRYIMNAAPDEEIDHKNNRDRLDNRRQNLRRAARHNNQHNTRKFKGLRSSKYKGVQWRSAKQRQSSHGAWLARICCRGNRVFLGYFASEEGAALAYDDAARRFHGEFARLNFPGPGERPVLEGAIDP